MLAECPHNPEHRSFITVAHVSEDWKVDERGNWIETLETLETVAKPDPGNEWVCFTCGAVAIVE